jgi:uncharacterized BrkB/YihY/UPF0761 family membrane protein
MEPNRESGPENGGEGRPPAFEVKILLLVLIPVSLALAALAGMAAAKGSTWFPAACWGAVLTGVGVFILGGVRLWQVGKFQQTGLRVGQVLGTIALLLLFVVAAGAFFFAACAMNFSISH